MRFGWILAPPGATGLEGVRKPHQRGRLAFRKKQLRPCEPPARTLVDNWDTRGLIALLAWEKSSGSGSARLGLSQKGDLPSSGERVIFIWSKVAGAR